MLRSSALILMIVACIAGVFGCSTSTPSSSADAQPAAPAPMIVALDRGGLLFIWSEGETLGRATQAADVPATSRRAVQIVDLNQPPEARAAHAWVYVADLTAGIENSTVTAAPVHRGELERTLRSAVLEAPKAPAVTMYSTSWCGVCKKARAFMQAEGISFVEKDIEKDQSAAEELQRKAAQAGVGSNGVPMFDIGGKIMGGFDPKALVAALGR
jgi:glutaredoxin